MNSKKLSMGEGDTPLIRLFNLEKMLNWNGELWAKAEYLNPTGSFKDRGSILEVIDAIKKRKKGVVCASTGNMAASLAAYAARFNLACFVVIPAYTPENKLKQALVSGAKLVKIEGNYDDCVVKAKKISDENNFLLCGDYELRRVGQRSLGRELATSGIDFDAFFVPVGNGTLGCAIIEGFIKSGQWPQFIGIQGKGADPLVRSFNENNNVINTIEKPETIASAIKVGNPLDGKLTLSWVRETNGEMISVDDKEIKNAQKLLSNKEGIYGETSAAATLAGLIKIKKEKYKDKNIVLILTGSGLKENN